MSSPPTSFDWRGRLLSHPRWPRLRAALLLAHALAVVVVAFPAPVKRLDDAAWQKPTMQAELSRWTERLHGWGLTWTQDELRERVTSLATAWYEGRRVLVAVPKAYLSALGTTQGWYMFTGADRVPQRFVLSVQKRDGALERVFALGEPSLHPELISDAFLAEHRVGRVLLLTAWSSRPEALPEACRWFTGQLRERSTTGAVVCQLEARAVEHPARVGAERPRELARTWVIHPDGREAEQLDEPRKRRRKGAKR
ncbi:MAG TPA: hypothetical protein VLC09_18320 [Polyangiaceae bacterium]|nr:hypothetical protein [Polyangiaceae bacterium]